MYRSAFQKFCRAAAFPVADYGDFRPSSEVISRLRDMTYTEKWQKSLQNNWFHVLMKDNSFFAFSVVDDLSFSYVACPLAVPAFDEYLVSIGAGDSPRSRRHYREEYSDVLATASMKPHVTPIRYDYSPKGYKPGIHPVAHLHVGLDNEMRIALRKEMTPLSFFLFVMKQIYPSCWERLVERHEFHQLSRHAKDSLIDIPDRFWSAADDCEIRLE